MIDQAEIHRNIVSVYAEVRREVASQLRYIFVVLPDRKQAWNDLHSLTDDNDSYVRLQAADALGSAFQHIPDKDAAWEDLHRLTGDKNSGVRRGAAYALGIAFQHVPDKDEACKDLHRLTGDEDRFVRGGIANALGIAFQHVPNKDAAWKYLIRMTGDEDKIVRVVAAVALGTTFQHVPDKDVAWEDLHRLTGDEDSDVRMDVANALGSAFQHVSDKDAAWKDLHRLTGDEDSDVRASSNHSLGRASIFKATEAEDEEGFKSELKNAIEFFERSSKEAIYSSPSRFCLPFYRSFYSLTFEKAGAEVEVKRYLAEAKSASEGSENKETLLKAVENLANALSEAHNATDFDTKKSELNSYRRYCEGAAELIGDAAEGAPVAVRVLQRGLPIIDERIKEIIREIQERARAVCKETQGTGTPYEPLGIEADRWAEQFSDRDDLQNEKIVSRLVHILGEFCDLLPEDKRTYPCRIVNEIREEDELGDKLNDITTAFSYLQPCIASQLKNRVKNMDDTKQPENQPSQKNGGAVTITTGPDSNVMVTQTDRGDVTITQGDTVTGRLHPEGNNAETDKPPKKEEQTETTTIPHLSYLESEIYDIFKSVYQKEREEGTSEVNSKTLELLKHKLFDLTASGKEIDWLDVGCGDGRCLEVLDAINNRKKIRYHGIDSLHKYLDDAEERARRYGIIATFDKTNAAVMNFDSEYDVVSAVLLLHEVDPLCLPYVLRNMLNALKYDGTLVISDFQGPYEQESDVVAWSAEDITNLLENIGVTGVSTEFIPSKQYPDDLGFYRCYVKKLRLDNEKFDELFQVYDDFLTAKKKESKRERKNLRGQIEERVRKLLNRPDIDLKNLSEEEMQRIRNEIEPEYGIKAYKVRLLESQIEFLDDKIKEFNNGAGCTGAD